MVVFGLGKNLLFKSILGRYDGRSADAQKSIEDFRNCFTQLLEPTFPEITIMKERQCEYFPLALFDTGFKRREKLPILAPLRDNFYAQGSSESK